MVSIGTASSGKEFAKGTEFPAESLFSDTTNNCYDALNFYSGLMRTFFDKSTAFSMQKRFSADGAQDLKDVMKNYKMLPPKVHTPTLTPQSARWEPEYGEQGVELKTRLPHDA